MQITNDELKKLPFQTYRKVALLQARPLTEDDFKQRKGVIQSLEGPVTFQVGDYLARGIQNEEWPISQEYFADIYEQVSEPDAEGFASYNAIGIRQACRMPEKFTVKRENGDVFTGKAGDYLVRSGNRMWVTDHNIFERSYELIS